MNLDNLTIPATAPEGEARSWSDRQEAFFTTLTNTTRSISLVAGPGTGKTTTGVEGFKRILGDNIYLAFNKSIAEELRSRGVNGRTSHSLGNQVLRRHLSKPKVSGYKTHDIIKAKYPQFDDYKYDVAQLVSLAKNQGIGIYGQNEIIDFPWNDIALDRGFDFPDGLTFYLPRIYNDIISNDQMIDFDDMLFYPLHRQWKLPRFECVFGDEFQDTNPLQLEWFERISSRLIAIGDPRQAIYGFRGSMQDVLKTASHAFESVELPLDITYRCGEQIVDLANDIYPGLIAHESTGAGHVEYVNSMPLDPPADSLIMCRNNYPLIRYALKLLRSRIKFKFLNDYPRTLEALLKKFDAPTLEGMHFALDTWRAAEEERLEGRSGALAALDDKHASLKSILDFANSPADAHGAIKELMFSSSGPTLCTIHKAKGLEASTAIILHSELMPSKWARSEDDIIQENNLRYVATTRAKHELIIHTGDLT